MVLESLLLLLINKFINFKVLHYLKFEDAMSATSDEINAYLFNIRSAFSDYGSNLANAQRIGRTDLDCYKMKFRILKYLVRIMVDYFDSDDYENVNFFTTSEARDVAQHINNICGTNYMIDF